MLSRFLEPARRNRHGRRAGGLGALTSSRGPGGDFKSGRFWPLKLRRLLRSRPTRKRRHRVSPGRPLPLEHQLDESVDFPLRIDLLGPGQGGTAPTQRIGFRPESGEPRARFAGWRRRPRPDSRWRKPSFWGSRRVAFMAFQQVVSATLPERFRSGTPRSKRPRPGKILKTPIPQTSQRDSSLSQKPSTASSWSDSTNPSGTRRFPASKDRICPPPPPGMNGTIKNRDHKVHCRTDPLECRVASCGYCWIGILSGGKHRRD